MTETPVDGLLGDMVELSVPPRAEYLQLVRAVIGAAVGSSVDGDGNPLLDSGRIADLRLVVSEAVTNAIEAQELLGAPERIFVRCQVEANQIVVEIADHGPGFRPDEVLELPPVETEERLQYESGLGISLMERLADSVAVETNSNGTLVRLKIGPG